MSDTGEFVVTWTGFNDGAASSVYARLFNADGTAAGNEFRVNTESTGAQFNASIDVDASTGKFIIVWQGNGPADSDGVFFRRFNADGSAIDASDTIAHTATDGTTSEFDSVVAWLTNGKCCHCLGAREREQNPFPTFRQHWLYAGWSDPDRQWNIHQLGAECRCQCIR